MDNVLRICCDKCSIIKKAYDTKQLLVYANGQSSPCLDLRRISPGNYCNLKCHIGLVPVSLSENILAISQIRERDVNYVVKSTEKRNKNVVRICGFV